MAIKPRLPPELIEEIRRRKARGDAMKVICIDLGVTSETVRKYTDPLNRRSPERRDANSVAWNGAPRPRPSMIPEEVVEGIRTEWRKGEKTQRAIADEFGVSKEFVRQKTRDIHRWT